MWWIFPDWQLMGNTTCTYRRFLHTHGPLQFKWNGAFSLVFKQIPVISIKLLQQLVQQNMIKMQKILTFDGQNMPQKVIPSIYHHHEASGTSRTDFLSIDITFLIVSNHDFLHLAKDLSPIPHKSLPAKFSDNFFKVHIRSSQWQNCERPKQKTSQMPPFQALFRVIAKAMKKRISIQDLLHQIITWHPSLADTIQMDWQFFCQVSRKVFICQNVNVTISPPFHIL